MTQPAATTMPSVNDYLAMLRADQPLPPGMPGLVVNGRADPQAVAQVAFELKNADAELRERIVGALVKVGLAANPNTRRGTECVREASVIAALVGPGFAKADLGREAAFDALRKLCYAEDLRPHAAAIAKALEDAPTREAFLLAAKVKGPEVRAVIEKLGPSARWQDDDGSRIARAAVGNKEIEAEYLAQLDEANADGMAMAKALGPPAMIGTPATLRAIAQRLRTPLTIHVPGAFEKSVRLNVLEALLYNFPDEPFFYPNNINKDADYAAAEKFCAERLGVTYAEPRPPFLTYRGYPIPPRK